MSSITKDQLKHLGKLACLDELENDSKIATSLQTIIPLLEKLNKSTALNNITTNQDNCLPAENSRQDIPKDCNGAEVLSKICASFNPNTQRITVPKVVEK